jgi:hypothetical protein
VALRKTAKKIENIQAAYGGQRKPAETKAFRPEGTGLPDKKVLKSHCDGIVIFFVLFVPRGFNAPPLGAVIKYLNPYKKPPKDVTRDYLVSVYKVALSVDVDISETN